MEDDRLEMGNGKSGRVNGEDRTANIEQPTSNIEQLGTHDPRPTNPNPPLANIVCLPYQPLSELAGSLSAADLHVVVMGEPFVGLVHPCKIYNVLAVGAPVLCIGPEASHLSEILGSLRSRVCARVGHGDVRECIGQICRIASENPRGESDRYETLAKQFSQRVLLPRLVAELEHRPEDL